MSCNKINLSGDWKLGWYPETVTGKWDVRLNYWKVEDGLLHGWFRHSTIITNVTTENDYTFECDFALRDENDKLTFAMVYSLHRLGFYGIDLKLGEKTKVYYLYGERFDHDVVTDIDVCLEKGKMHHFKYTLKGDNICVYIDDKLLAEFECDCVYGRKTAFMPKAGTIIFDNVKITDDKTGEVIFFDDFSENSLIKKTDVALSEFDAIDNWIDATVPCSVQTALLNAGLAKDPYYGYNGPELMWVDRQRWVFKKKFTVPDSCKQKTLRLEFEGVDYHGWFWLNGQSLGYHEGMFGGPDVDITKLVKYGEENELVVCILPMPDPQHANVSPWILNRWHFNMDIVPIGIWRDVNIVVEDNITLFDPQVITKKIENGTAYLDLSVSVGNMALFPFEVKGKFILHSPNPCDEDVVVEFMPGFFQGSLRVDCRAEIPNARLWWPHGMGEQNLYDVDVIVDIYEYTKSPEPTGHDELHFRTGIRTLRKDKSPNTNPPIWPYGGPERPEGPYNWILVVNDVPFFGKGSNWMPIDQMLDLKRERYEMLLRRARECNINILRPWGAGLIETNDFYEVCDELGILVWQELLVANGYYDQSNLSVWQDTIRRNVLRIRNHPSLAVWCAGNEFDPDCELNRNVIDEIGNICEELDPTRDYHRCCPYGGDSHSYVVNWMGGAYYTRFTEDTSIAITEFSMASPPHMETLKRIIPNEELNVWPPNLPDTIPEEQKKNWGEGIKRRESGFSMHDAHLNAVTGIMIPYMSECGLPHSWDDFVLYMQTGQGLLTQYGIDLWRSRWPYCTMTMSWVFNVIHPDTYCWSYIDYYGLPKISYFYKKRSYEQLHVTAIFDDLFTRAGDTFKAKLTVINETVDDHIGSKINVRLYNQKLELLSEQSVKADAMARTTEKVGVFEYAIPANAVDEVMFLCADLVSESGELLSRSQYCPRVGTPSETMPFLSEGPWIVDVKDAPTTLNAQYSVSEQDGRYVYDVRIAVTGALPAYQVGIHAPENEEFVTYSDNFFWMESGEVRNITVTSEKKLEELTVDAWNATQISVL